MRTFSIINVLICTKLQIADQVNGKCYAHDSARVCEAARAARGTESAHMHFKVYDCDHSFAVLIYTHTHMFNILHSHWRMYNSIFLGLPCVAYIFACFVFQNEKKTLCMNVYFSLFPPLSISSCISPCAPHARTYYFVAVKFIFFMSVCCAVLCFYFAKLIRC